MHIFTGSIHTISHPQLDNLPAQVQAQNQSQNGAPSQSMIANLALILTIVIARENILFV